MTFANNVVRGSTSGVIIHGRDNNNPSQPTKRIVIKTNLFVDVGGPRWGGEGRLFQILDGTASIVIRPQHRAPRGYHHHRRRVAPPGFRLHQQHRCAQHLRHRRLRRGGTQALEALFPGAVARRNVIVGGSSAEYPRDNFVVGSWEKVKFEDLSRGRLRLTDGSPYRRASLDGKDVGVDDGALQAAVGPASRRRR